MLDRLRLILQRRLDTLTGHSATEPSTHAPDTESTERLRKRGNALLAEEDLEGAEACFREALTYTVDDAQTLVCLGYVLKEQGRLAEARVILKRVAHPANTEPQAFEAHYLLGEIGERQQDFEDAKKCFKAALGLKPDFLRACEDVIRILHAQGREWEVRTFLQERVLSSPNNADYRVMLAQACTAALDLENAVVHMKTAVDMGVRDVRMCITLGAALCRLEREIEARPYFELVLAADRSLLHEVLYYRGYHFARMGNSSEAADLLEQSVLSQPDYLSAHSQLLLTLSHAARELNRSYRQAAERFDNAIATAYPEWPALAVEPGAGDKHVLRVGFVAGEFREHPVYHFLAGILEHMDRDRFQLVAFSNNQIDDSATQALKTLFTDWHDIKSIGHDAVAELVRDQQIDILIDLSGHSGDARLPVFARRPAPVQVAWLGYFASTGLKTMDYIIADAASVPHDSQEWFSEKVFRLPATRLCMTTPRTSRQVPVVEAPCVAKGYITFGTFQQAAKINARVLQVWAQILDAVPQSRLKIQNSGLNSASIREKTRSDIIAAGIDVSRVELAGAGDWEAYLEAHGDVDILFDTFPYPGGTTTAFAIWMGVPTVTLAGDTMLSLQGAAMLGCVGLDAWIAETEAQYVDIAVRFARDKEQLSTLRHSLRATAEQSPLFDTATFATHLQSGLRAMYAEKMAFLANGPASRPQPA